MKRRWEKDLDDPGSALAKRERARAAEAARAEPVNVAAYVREVLDGAVDDVDLPATYVAAPGEAGEEAIAVSQLAVYRDVERALAERLRRSLSAPERELLLQAFGAEWERRAAAEREARRGVLPFPGTSPPTRGAA